jgi:Flp pilus assembly protein TadD/mono/diheme cytochrome c family protein
VQQVSGQAFVLTLIALAATAGCRAPSVARYDATALTYNRDIAPIIREHCVVCHRPGQVGPFSLIDYAGVRQHARQIVQVTQSRVMPPWLPQHGFGEFAGERRLSDAELRRLADWVANGTVEGDPIDRPEPPAAVEGWPLGQPDLIVALPAAYTLRADGPNVFRNFVLPVDIPEIRYVRGVDIRPGNRAVVHHASIAIDRTRASRRLDDADPEPGYEGLFADTASNPDSRAVGWTPGMTPVLDPPDTAWRLYPGSDLVLQLHMIPSGKPETVRPSIGLYFSKTPPTHPTIDFKLGSKTIDIPAGEAHYPVEDRYKLPTDVDLLTIYPHAHYLAKEMKAYATLPDGTVRQLIWIKNWNFNWQDQYRYATPIALPAGTVLTMQYTYDNSAANPHNPSNPPRRVQYGPQSSDEMGDLWLRFVPRRPEDAHVLAQSYLSRELAKWITVSELAVRSKPDDASAHNELGTHYLEAGQREDGIRELREAVRLRPSFAEAHSNLGTALRNHGQDGEAMTHLREAARLAPTDDRVQMNLADALDAGGQAAEAITHYERALALNPDLAAAHNNLGALLASRGRTADAAQHFKRALAIQPEYADAKKNLALLEQITASPAKPAR